MFLSTILSRAILTRLERANQDGDAWLSVGGLDRLALADATTTIEPGRWNMLVAEAMRMLADPGLGLSMGFGESIGTLQLLGYMLNSARSLQDAFDLCLRYSSLVVDSMQLELLHCGQLSHLRFAFPACAEPEALRFGEDLTASLIWQLSSHPTARAKPRLHLRQPTPAYRDRMEALFGCEIVFGHPHSEVVFNRQVLDRSQPHGDPSVVTKLVDAAETALLVSADTRSLENRVRLALTEETDLGAVELSTIATRLGMNVRKLRRSLRSEGASLRGIVDAFRRDLALRKLRVPNTTIKDVAEVLGYSEPSAFHRAFKRWTGVAPATFARNFVVER